jgi:hypothetical protein
LPREGQEVAWKLTGVEPFDAARVPAWLSLLAMCAALAIAGCAGAGPMPVTIIITLPPSTPGATLTPAAVPTARLSSGWRTRTPLRNWPSLATPAS